MDPVTIGLVSMGVGGAIKALGGLFGGIDEADLMRQKAQLKLSTLEENMRRTEGRQTQVLSSTKARMAGTGFDADSASFSKYITSMATEFDAQNKFTHAAGLKEVDLMRQGADMLDNPFKLGLGVASDLLGTGAGMAHLSALGG